MGTRNLTIVISEGKTKIAQYCQWDGYLSGQGKTVLNFLKCYDLEIFKHKVDTIPKWITESEHDDLLKKAGHKGGEWMGMDVANKFKELHPQLDRDMGANVLDFIYNANEPVLLQDQYSFAADGLFCEYAYVIDLDKNTLEVYTGFNKQPLTEGERFYPLQQKGEEYAPVKLAATFQLNDLPTYEKFILIDEEVEEEETD